MNLKYAFVRAHIPFPAVQHRTTFASAHANAALGVGAQRIGTSGASLELTADELAHLKSIIDLHLAAPSSGAFSGPIVPAILTGTTTSYTVPGTGVGTDGDLPPTADLTSGGYIGGPGITDGERLMIANARADAIAKYDAAIGRLQALVTAGPRERARVSAILNADLPGGPPYPELIALLDDAPLYPRLIATLQRARDTLRTAVINYVGNQTPESVLHDPNRQQINRSNGYTDDATTVHDVRPLDDPANVLGSFFRAGTWTSTSPNIIVLGRNFDGARHDRRATDPVVCDPSFPLICDSPTNDNVWTQVGVLTHEPMHNDPTLIHGNYDIIPLERVVQDLATDYLPAAGTVAPATPAGPPSPPPGADPVVLPPTVRLDPKPGGVFAGEIGTTIPVDPNKQDPAADGFSDLVKGPTTDPLVIKFPEGHGGPPPAAIDSDLTGELLHGGGAGGGQGEGPGGTFGGILGQPDGGAWSGLGGLGFIVSGQRRTGDGTPTTTTTTVGPAPTGTNQGPPFGHDNSWPSAPAPPPNDGGLTVRVIGGGPGETSTPNPSTDTGHCEEGEETGPCTDRAPPDRHDAPEGAGVTDARSFDPKHLLGAVVGPRPIDPFHRIHTNWDYGEGGGGTGPGDKSTPTGPRDIHDIGLGPGGRIPGWIFQQTVNTHPTRPDPGPPPTSNVAARMTGTGLAGARLGSTATPAATSLFAKIAAAVAAANAAAAGSGRTG